MDLKIKYFVPPVLWAVGKFAKAKVYNLRRNLVSASQKNGSTQALDVYWTKEMANLLETWGAGHAWIEIECLLVNCQGKVLDIACGTGVNIKALERFENLEVHGFDISDLLLTKAKEKGLLESRLKLNDATKTDYADGEFDYSYSIGSLEHFTEDGIEMFLAECARYTSKTSFHMIPLSRDDRDRGWINRMQSYHNNSRQWWMRKFSRNFSKIYTIGSGWDDGESIGQWFICVK